MILEMATLEIRPGQTDAFEAAFAQASPIIAAAPGYLSHELRHCIESPHRYLLLVNWCSVEDHERGFRQSDAYQAWRRLLHHFYDPFPQVQHYALVQGGLCRDG